MSLIITQLWNERKYQARIYHPLPLYDCNNAIMTKMASQMTSLTIVYSTIYSKRRSNENIKAPRHWPLCDEFTGDRLIHRTKGQ